jgi:voltage-gated potassium channel
MLYDWLIAPQSRDGVTKRPDTMIRQKLHEIIFGISTPAGKAFDVALIISILMSVMLVMYETTLSESHSFRPGLVTLEWIFTVMFTIEYLVRIWISQEKLKYVFSWYGLIDLLSIVPTYLAYLLPGANSFVVVRILRVLRVFRVLRLSEFSSQSQVILRAMGNSWRKIMVFMMFTLTLVTVYGAMLYVVEGSQNGFDNLPKSVYWAIVTITTVGYGDIVPQTPLGKFIASMIMITGYAIIAVPTGIVTTEMMSSVVRNPRIRCNQCGTRGHDPEANCCRNCGARLSSAGHPAFELTKKRDEPLDD